MKRRTFIKGILAATGATVVAGTYAWQVEPLWLEFVKLKMPVKHLPPQLAGKTLMQISDIHVGPRFDYHFIISSFNKASELNPDFVVYTGDYVSGRNSTIQYDKLQEVLTHSVKGKLGTVAILGNHDYGKNWSEEEVCDRVTHLLGKNHIPVLRNEQIEMGGINFIGFDDYWGLNFQPWNVMKDYDPTQANIVLCHNPDVCDLDVWNNYEGWILSGHTHGGQVRPPLMEAPIIPVKNKKYTRGKIPLSGNRTLYINRALGHSFQVRMNVRPEITIFELEIA